MRVEVMLMNCPPALNMGTFSYSELETMKKRKRSNPNKTIPKCATGQKEHTRIHTQTVYDLKTMRDRARARKLRYKTSEHNSSNTSMLRNTTFNNTSSKPITTFIDYRGFKLRKQREKWALGRRFHRQVQSESFLLWKHVTHFGWKHSLTSCHLKRFRLHAKILLDVLINSNHIAIFLQMHTDVWCSANSKM